MELFDSLLVALSLIADSDYVFVERLCSNRLGRRLLVKSPLDFDITLRLTKARECVLG